MQVDQSSDVTQPEEAQPNEEAQVTSVEATSESVEIRPAEPAQDVRPAPQSLSRRRLLTAGLVGGGLVTLGLSGFAFWKYQQRSLKVIGQMKAGISSLAWAPDGRSFAIGDDSGLVKVWNFASRQPLYSREMRMHLSPAQLAWSPDGQYLVVGGDGSAHIWKASTGTTIADYYFVDRSFAWSPNGKMLASGGRFGLIQIWNPANGAGLYSLQAYMGTPGVLLTINSIAWAPDSTRFATVGPQNGEVIVIWNATTRQAQPLPFNIHVADPVQSRMNAIGWSPNSTYIAAGYADGHKNGQVLLWTWQPQSKSWQQGHPIAGHAQGVNGISWSPDSTRFASVGMDTTIQVWNMSDGLQMDISASSQGMAGSSSLNALAWSPDGQYVLIGDDVGQILLWDVA